jgi:hypothetical protein
MLHACLLPEQAIFCAAMILKKANLLKTILSAFLLVLASSCYSQVIKFDKKVPLNWQTFHLKGKVKSITEFNFKQYLPKKDEDEYVTAENLKFDSAGNCIDKAFFMQAGGFGGHYIYQYDKEGNNIEIKDFSEDGRYHRYVYKYDKQGNQIESMIYDLTGRLDYTEVCSYDKQGNYITVLHKGARSYRETYTYLYDAKNRIISSKQDSENKTEYRYNKDTVEEIYNGNYGEEHVKTVYNKNQQMVLRKSMGDKAGVSRPFVNTYKYDAAGNQTEIKQTKEGEVLKFPYSQRFGYVYDKNGNWIKRTTMTLEGTPMNSVERKIEYY